MAQLLTKEYYNAYTMEELASWMKEDKIEAFIKAEAIIEKDTHAHIGYVISYLR